MVPNKNIKAYSMLYEIENELKRLSESQPYNATLFDMIKVVEDAPQQNRLITEKTIKKLYWIVEIRNKVCHMKEINKREYEMVLDCWYDFFCTQKKSLERL